MQKGFCPKQGKSLKNYAILGLVASQGGGNYFICCKIGCPKSTKSRNPHKYWVFRHI